MIKSKKAIAVICITAGIAILAAILIFRYFSSDDRKVKETETIPESLYDQELEQFLLGGYYFGTKWRYVCGEIGLSNDIAEYSDGFMVGEDSISLSGTGVITSRNTELFGSEAVMKYHFYEDRLVGVSYDYIPDSITPDFAESLSTALSKQYEELERKATGSLDNLDTQPYEEIWIAGADINPNYLRLYVIKDGDGNTRISIFAGYDIPEPYAEPDTDSADIPVEAE